MRMVDDSRFLASGPQAVTEKQLQLQNCQARKAPLPYISHSNRNEVVSASKKTFCVRREDSKGASGQGSIYIYIIMTITELASPQQSTPPSSFPDFSSVRLTAGGAVCR